MALGHTSWISDFERDFCHLVISALAEEKVQPAFLCRIAADDDDGDEGEGGGGLPDLHPVGTDQDEDDEEPDVGEEREDHGHNEDRVGLDPPGLPRRDDDDAEMDDMTKVVSNRKLKSSCRMTIMCFHAEGRR